jgi:hypothetical protein
MAKLPPALKTLAKEAFVYRALDEKSAQTLAVVNEPKAKLLDAENAQQSVLGSIKHRGTVNAAADDLAREIRRHAATAERNKAALAALERYLQLAEAEGQDELLAMGLAVFQKLRQEAPQLRAAKLFSTEDDELERQHLKMLADREKLEATIGLLNHDLNVRLGTRLEAKERFWPKEDFSVWSETIDVEAAVKYALENRSDLRMIRVARDRLNNDSFPTVEKALFTIIGMTANQTIPAATKQSRWRSLLGLSPLPASNLLGLESRLNQLNDYLAAQEQEAEKQVRTAAMQLGSAAKRIALLRARAESLGEKLERARTKNLLADVLLLESEHLKARGELLSAVIEWHQWRIKLRGAQGLLASECLPNDPPSEPQGPGQIPLKVKKRLH